MDEANQLAFLWRFVEATDAGKLSWASDNDSEYDFIVWTDRWAYKIRSRDKDDQGPYYFTIYKVERGEDGNKTGKPLDTWSTGEYHSLFDSMESLYQSVKRKVMGYDDLVVDMFSSLAQIDGGSPTPPQVSPKAAPDDPDPWAAALQEDVPPF